MNNIDIIISAEDIKKQKIQDKSVVVVDMLRATSVITTAIYNGCRYVIPVLTIDEAVRIAKQDRSSYMLGGERNAMKIDGFDFSNSPLEYTKDRVRDKILVMTTTNGTRAIKGSVGAKYIYIASMLNAGYIGRKLAAMDNDIVIVNSGTNGQFSMDDFICSGYIIENITERKEGFHLTDIAKTAKYIYDNNLDIVSFIKHAGHYKIIQGLKLQKDLDYCCQKSIFDVIPEYRDGCIFNGQI